MISLTSHINLGLEPRLPENDPLAFQRRMNREISPGVEWKPQKWWNLGWFLVGIQWGKKMGKAWFKHINVHCSCNWLITIRLVSPQIVGLFMFLPYDRILQHISTNGLVVSKHDYQPQNVECGSRGSVPKTRRGSTLGHFGYDSVGSLGKILTSFVARWFLMFFSIVSTWLLQFVPSKASTFSRA